MYDRVTKEILYAKDINKQRPPASTTKIMTGILAIEMGSPDDEVVISPYAASLGGTSLYLKEGEVWKIEDLLLGTLLKSGNDAAAALGEGIAGSEALFVEIMNKKAFLLGASSTNFRNTNGLPKEGHVSSSYDLAVIADYALNNPVFADIVSTKDALVKDHNNTRQHNLRNTNQLLASYKGANGVKTGTTNAAGQCLVASAERGSRKLISVVLKSGDRYGDSRRLLNSGFEDYCLFTIPKGTVVGRMYFSKAVPYQVDLVTTKDCSYTVSMDRLGAHEKKLVLESAGLPLKDSEKVGYLEIKANEQYKIPVTVADKVRKETLSDCIKKICMAIYID